MADAVAARGRVATGAARWSRRCGAKASAEPTPQRRIGFAGRLQVVPPGSYRVVLSVDGKDYTQPLRVEADPVRSSDASASGGPDDQDDDDKDDGSK